MRPKNNIILINPNNMKHLLLAMAVAGMPVMFAHAATTADNATQPTFTE